MITLLIGENSLLIKREIDRLEASSGLEAERYDGESLSSDKIPELIMGGTLFATKRFVVVNELSASREAWDYLAEIAGQVSEDIHLVLVEPSPDKRTRTYKALQKEATVKEFKFWTERDAKEAERWIIKEAESRKITLDREAATLLVKRSLVQAEKGPALIDQWRLLGQLDKLSVLEKIDVQSVEKYTEGQPIESVFSLLETSIRGDSSRLRSLLDNLKVTEDPYKIFGLLSSQAFQVAALASSEQSSEQTSRLLGFNPYVVRSIAPLSKKLGRRGSAAAIDMLVEADESMKNSTASPWLAIERALVKISKIK